MDDKDTKFARRFIKLNTPLLKILHRVKYVGTENIPQGGGYIVAANHISVIDPFYVALGSKIELHYMAKSDAFKNKFATAFLKKMHAFPVRRNEIDIGAVKKAVELVKNGKILGIFPEGGVINKDSLPADLKQGTAYIAAKCKCGVLPVSIYNESGSKFFTPLTIRFGEFIPYEELGLGDKPKKGDYEHASEIIVEKIRALWSKGYA